jgi:hypothetical protein
VLSGDGDRRPHVDVTERGTVVVRGANLLASSSANAPAAAVECVEIPLDVWASVDEQVFSTELTADAFENEFDRVAGTAFRLETRQDYTGATGPRYEFWQRGEQMPVRSPQTSGWLARVASSTAQGKRWQRVHVVDLPLRGPRSTTLPGERGGPVRVRAGEETLLRGDPLASTCAMS